MLRSRFNRDDSKPIMAKRAILPSDVAARVVNVGKRYGSFWAVRNVSLEVRRGESVGIIGLNGAGKSTLLQMISGAIPPTEGDIAVSGKVIPLLELGATFNDDFTGIENLYLSATTLGVAPSVVDQNRAEIEDFAEIGEFFTKPIRTYSSGMRVRLAFALLTQIKPDLLIIDEALSVGDAYFAHKCMRLLQRFRSEGRSLLFVSHDPGAVKTFCDRAILLDRGNIGREGRPSDVLDYYNAMIAVKEREHEIRVAEAADGVRRTRSGDQRAQLERFDLFDERGQSIRAVASGSKVVIACAVRFRAPVESPTVGFLVRDRLGNDVFGTNTFNLGFPTQTFQPDGVLEVEFETRLNLGAGNYSITLAVHAGSDHRQGNYDWWDNLIAFTVVHAWAFAFTGVAALPVSVRTSTRFESMGRTCGWSEPLQFGVGGNARSFLLSGWSPPEATHCWTSGGEAWMAVSLPSPEACQIVAHVFPFLPPTLSAQRVQLYVDGVMLNEWSVSEATTLRARLPSGGVDKRELRLCWRLLNPCSPAAAGLSADTRELAIAFREICFVSEEDHGH